MGKKLFNQTAEFKALQSKWNQKLKDSGFEDIENGQDNPVVRPQIIKTMKTQYDGGNDYFQLCQDILRDFRFRKDVHRIIFALHAEGRSERDIVQHLIDKNLEPFSQKGVNLLIKRTKESFIKGVA